jgi:hypothetical protein
MTPLEIQKFGEIQYLKGRLDELHKALPNITNLERKRKIDQRISKYFAKLEKVDGVAYHLYQLELFTRNRAKLKSIEDVKSLLEDILQKVDIKDQELKDKIIKKLESY